MLSEIFGKPWTEIGEKELRKLEIAGDRWLADSIRTMQGSKHMEILSAKSANELRMSINTEEAKAQIKMVNAAIEEAMQTNSQYINIYEPLKVGVKKTLLDAGWEIAQEGTQRNEYLLQLKLPDELWSEE